MNAGIGCDSNRDDVVFACKVPLVHDAGQIRGIVGAREVDAAVGQGDGPSRCVVKQSGSLARIDHVGDIGLKREPCCRCHRKIGGIVRHRKLDVIDRKRGRTRNTMIVEASIMDGGIGHPSQSVGPDGQVAATERDGVADGFGHRKRGERYRHQ